MAAYRVQEFCEDRQDPSPRGLGGGVPQIEAGGLGCGSRLDTRPHPRRYTTKVSLSLSFFLALSLSLLPVCDPKAHCQRHDTSGRRSSCHRDAWSRATFGPGPVYSGPSYTRARIYSGPVYARDPGSRVYPRHSSASTRPPKIGPEIDDSVGVGAGQIRQRRHQALLSMRGPDDF